MHRPRRSPVALLSALLLVSVLGTPAAAQPTPASEPQPTASAALISGQVRIVQVDDGFVNPLGVANAGDGSGRLFVLEKRGTVRTVLNNKLQSGYFLDIRGVTGGLTVDDGERGLLGMAFHPQFETNRKLFVYYTNGGGDLVIAEFTANAGGTAASVSTAHPLLTIEHSLRSNHNGGQLLFGPGGHLYIFTGDGGGSGDPDENAQDVNTLLGKTLRVTPNLAGGYTNPSGNPYVGEAGRDEIWSIGLRNPWRASFDRANGRLWIADVGQGSWEEINREPANTSGRNYGWDCREGLHAYETAGCSGLSFTNPVAEYGHAEGDCSVTGGYVYRGSIFSDFQGKYVFGDFCSGRIWTLDGESPSGLLFHRDTSALITAFGESEGGEIYMVDYGQGILYRVVAPPFSDVANNSLLDHIMWAYNARITSGCGGGRFCPNDSVTRAEMAAFLARALELPATNQDFFADDDGHTLEISINRIAAAGITFGCAWQRYCPDSPVTRAEMASFIDRALDLPRTANDYFVDDEGLTHEDAINRLARAKITGGCTQVRYCPSHPTTRAQMTAFLRRALDR